MHSSSSPSSRQPYLDRISLHSSRPNKLTSSSSNLIQSPLSSDEQNWSTPFPQNEYHAFPPPSISSTTPFEPTSTPHHHKSPEPLAWQRQRAISSYQLESATLTFPEPQLHRATSSKAILRPHSPPSYKPHQRAPASSHRNSVAAALDTHKAEAAVLEDQPDLNKLRLELFQSGKIPDSEQEWDRFVPRQALEALGKQEVERQSALFEVFKSELDYVNDLQIIQDVFVGPLSSVPNEIMTEEKGRVFVSEVFWNLKNILAHHQRMLGSLLSRQRDQHPLVQSIADIVLDNALLFTPEYESYIKHSPLSLEYHRKELDQNARYKDFIRKCSEDPRLRKRDFKTLFSRPITRLPRLKLVMERIQKLTAPDHPDLETIPIVLAVLQDFIKSSEPGIAAAEDKVKFWALYESLGYPQGEIIDIEPHDSSRTLIHAGPLARQKSDSWRSWSDVFGALLDNYFLLLKEETRLSETVKRSIVLRPIPLEYLRLGSFNEPPEVRRERADNGSIISINSTKQNLYPFSVYHAGAKAASRYTLYTQTAAAREKWHKALVDAIGLRKARQDANKWFAPQTLNDGFFRVPSRIPHVQGTHFTGRAVCVAVFPSQGRNYLAVGCTNGIYVGMRTDSSFRRVLEFTSPTSIVALPTFNKFLVHYETALFSYPLDLCIRVSQGKATAQSLYDSAERLGQKDGSVSLFNAGRIADRTLVVYATKSFMHVTLHTLEVVRQDENPLSSVDRASSYRPFGSPVPIPREAHNAVFLPQNVAICASKSVHILKPMNMTVSSPTVVPNFIDVTGGTNTSLSLLKERWKQRKSLDCISFKVNSLSDTSLELGYYIDKYGKPARSSGYISWECKATAYAHRGSHLLLFSPGFIEVRSIHSGKLVQVIEGNDVRLLHCGLAEQDMLIAAMTGDVEDARGLSEKLVELVQTSAIDAQAPLARAEQLWDEWDM
ncbi:hypothetical protein B0F90DRAFT_1816034 [Multifurca ochricompacta]|uniref:Uncharacterized protein n=1 Tax=Multifurca ochricompacta TaxID=376703 RepID=A0AAD4QMF5_9AGAM|nr:hypothetical protein B0F90DRAFT_1816034 [Multifurca ochricompacta]